MPPPSASFDPIEAVAKHTTEDGQSTPEYDPNVLLGVQVLPESVVTSKPDAPTVTHIDTEGHERAKS